MCILIVEQYITANFNLKLMQKRIVHGFSKFTTIINISKY